MPLDKLGQSQTRVHKGTPNIPQSPLQTNVTLPFKSRLSSISRGRALIPEVLEVKARQMENYEITHAGQNSHFFYSLALQGQRPFNNQVGDIMTCQRQDELRYALRRFGTHWHALVDAGNELGWQTHALG